MISTAEVQAAVIATLKADVDVVGALNGDDTEIREEQWMGTDYDYPCYRVHITRLTPAAVPGNCEDDVMDCDFNVSFRAVNPSSTLAADGMAHAVDALQGVKLASAAFVARSAVKLADVSGPIAEAENAWMARAFFNCQLKEI